MHDRQLEDQVRIALRREGDSLPLTVTSAELERRFLLRKRERTDRRLSLVAAAVGVFGLGTALAIGNGLLRLPAVGEPSGPPPTVIPTGVPASSQPSIAPTPTPGPSAPADPLGGLPDLPIDPVAIDSVVTEDAGDQADTTPDLTSRPLSGATRLDASSAALTIACDGPDAVLRWGTSDDPTRLLDERIACDGAPQRVEVDLTMVQPMIDYVIYLDATPATAMRAIVETFGYSTDAGRLPPVAAPDGTVLIDEGDPDSGEATGTMQSLRVGAVPPRPVYRVAISCFGVGTARWSIGQEGEADFVARGEVDCRAGAVGVTVAEGIQPYDAIVWLTTDAANAWRIIISDPYGPVSFIAPRLVLSSEESIDGVFGTGLGGCVSQGEGGDSCAGIWLARDGAPVLTVPAGARVVARIEDGWSFQQARMTAGRRDDARMSMFVDDETDLGSRPDGGSTISFQLGDLAPGEWLIRVRGSAEKGDDTFSAYYDIPVMIVE